MESAKSVGLCSYSVRAFGSSLITLHGIEGVQMLRVFFRVQHEYRNTHSVSKTGSTGTGTVVDFGTPQHTVYLYHRFVGMYGYITVE